VKRFHRSIAPHFRRASHFPNGIPAHFQMLNAISDLKWHLIGLFCHFITRRHSLFGWTRTFSDLESVFFGLEIAFIGLENAFSILRNTFFDLENTFLSSQNEFFASKNAFFGLKNGKIQPINARSRRINVHSRWMNPLTVRIFAHFRRVNGQTGWPRGDVHPADRHFRTEMRHSNRETVPFTPRN
jgi:hypothetical protein